MHVKKKYLPLIITVMLALVLCLAYAVTGVASPINDDDIIEVVEFIEMTDDVDIVVEEYQAMPTEIAVFAENISTIPINAHFYEKWQFHEIGDPIVIKEKIGGRINLQAFYFTAEHDLPCDMHANGACSQTHSWACGEKYIPPTGDIASYTNCPTVGCAYPVKSPNCTNVSCFEGHILNGTLASGNTLVYQWYMAATPTNDPANAIALETDTRYGNGREYIVDTGVAAGLGTRYYFVELTHTAPGNVVKKYYSDPVEITIEPFDFPIEQMLPSERSGYRVDTRSPEVAKFLETIVAASEGRIRMDIIGYTLGIPPLPAGVTGTQAADWRIAMRGTKPQPIYLLVMGEKGKPLPTCKEDVDPSKAVFMVNAGIHAGEYAPKESMLLLARDIAHGKYDDLLKDAVILSIPNHNADGNDYLSSNGLNGRGNRQSMGVINPHVNNASYTDSNANNAYNVNRDSTKLDAPETRALVKVLREWDPMVYMDLHEGSTIMRESNTWAHGLHKGSYEPIREYNRLGFFDIALGEDSFIVKEKGKRSVIYAPSASTSGVHGGTHGSGYTAGPMQSGTAQWRTFQDHPRFNTNYAGIRNRLSFLNETYASDMSVVRIDTQYNLTLSTLKATISEMDIIKGLITDADTQAIGRKDDPDFPNGEFVILESVMNPRDHDKEGIYNLHTYLAGAGSPVTTSISGGEGRGRFYAGLANYPIMVMDNFDARKSTPLGAYYLLDKDCENAVANLRFHGIQVDVLTHPVTLPGGDFQWFDATERGDETERNGYFEGRQRVYREWRNGVQITDGTGAMIPTWRGEWEQAKAPQTFPVGTYVVSTAQPLGMLAALLLEPGSNDGLFNWNFFQEVYDQNPLAVDHFDNRLDKKEGMVRSNYPTTVTTNGTDYEGTYYFPVFKTAQFIDDIGEDYNFHVYLQPKKEYTQEGDPLLVDVMLIGDLNYTQVATEIVYDTDLLEFAGYEYLQGWVAMVNETEQGQVTVRSMASSNMITGTSCIEGVTVATLKFNVKSGSEAEACFNFASTVVTPVAGVVKFSTAPGKPLTVVLHDASTIPINAHFNRMWQFYEIGQPLVIQEKIGGRINLQAFYFTSEHTLPCDKHADGACSQTHSWACGEVYIPPTGDIANYTTCPTAGCAYPVKSPDCTNVSCFEGRILAGTTASGNTLRFQWYMSNIPTNDPEKATLLLYERGNEYMVDTSVVAGTGARYYFVELTHTAPGNVITKYYSDPVKVVIDPFGFPLDQMLASERSGYRSDTRSAEVADYLETIVAASEGRMRLDIIGYTLGIPELPAGVTGNQAIAWKVAMRGTAPQPIYLLVMGDKNKPLPQNKYDVDPDKAIFMVNAGIHAGECAPKESMLLFARDVAHGVHDDLLKEAIILSIPNHCADANDYLSSGAGAGPKVRGNRQTMGVINPYVNNASYTDSDANNAYNVNRDSTKLDAPETRALVKVLNEWDPLVYMDLHQGSTIMRESNTWAHGLHKGSYEPIREYNRLGFFDVAMGEDSYIVQEKGKRSVIYAPSASTSGVHGGTHGSGLTAGPMQSGRAQWRTFQDHPRFNTNYVGLRNRISFLNETYSSDMFVVRVDTQYDLTLSTLKATISEKDTVKKLVAEADAQAIGRQNDPNFPSGEFVILESTMNPRDHEKEGIYNLHTYLAGAGSPYSTSISSGEPTPPNTVVPPAT
ncbi:MAG: hypothetical protein FWG43_04170, partial [Clostridiales bacterium]|nr:hypothetical protein [Clostridiales bacterium]